MNKLLKLVLSGLLILGLVSCHDNNKQSNTLKVGTIEGPETQLMETAAQVAKQQYGLNVKIVTFSEYALANAALNDGSINANMIQHVPFLQSQIKARHYQLTPIGKTFIYPVGIYSKKIKNLADLEQGSRVALPNDPSNEARALLLLQQAKLIELNPKATIGNITPLDVTANPYHLIFSELDAAQLPRALDDVDLAVINTNYAIPAGLSPSKNALFHEDKDSPYANVLVVRTQDKDDPRLQHLVAALHSPAVSAKAKQLFGPDAIPAF